MSVYFSSSSFLHGVGSLFSSWQRFVTLFLSEITPSCIRGSTFSAQGPTFLLQDPLLCLSRSRNHKVMLRAKMRSKYSVSSLVVFHCWFILYFHVKSCHLLIMEHLGLLQDPSLPRITLLWLWHRFSQGKRRSMSIMRPLRNAISTSLKLNVLQGEIWSSNFVSHSWQTIVL